MVFADSKHLEPHLMLYGVDVIVVGPGAVMTPIWDKAAAEDDDRFNTTDYGPIIQRFLTFFAEEGKKGQTLDKI